MAAPPLSFSLGSRLSLMMFLQYAIWGAWLPLLWPFLRVHRGFEPSQIGDMFAIGAVGALVAPFIAGQIADRYFATERFLAISHIAGGVLVWQLAWIESYWSFLAFSLVYSLIYAPTLSLTNSLAFHHLPDRDRDFGKVRVWGTVGWIAVGIGIGHWLLASYTIGDEEAVTRIVQSEMGDAPSRARLVEHSHVRLADRSTRDGLAFSNPDGSIVVETTGDEGALTREVFPRDQVESMVPLYEALAAEGRADVVLGVVERLNADDGQASREAAVDELLEREALSSSAVGAVKYPGQVAGMSDAFRLSAVLGIFMGLYCLLLPHTPPMKGRQKFASLEAMGEIRRNPLLTLFILAVPISCIHQFYFVHTAGFLGDYQSDTAAAINRVFGVGGGGLMTLGQMSEILVLALIPLVAKRVSRRTLLGVGIVAYALRMFLFGYVDAIHAATGVPEVAVLMLGVSMHGLCFGCFIFVAFMIVDEETTGDVRASAQSLFNVVIVGIGIIVGSKIATGVADWATRNGALDYRTLFSVPMWASVACLVVLLVFYPGGKRGGEAPPEPPDA